MPKNHETLEVNLPDASSTLKIASAFSGHDDDVRRFREVFLNVWNKIATADRGQIAAFWLPLCSSFSPKFVLDFPLRDDALACTEECGALVRLDWGRMQRLPDPIMENPVAHEMAHVFQWAIGKNRFNLTNQDLLGIVRGVNRSFLDEFARVELHADETMTRWGFDPIGHWVWFGQHMDMKNGEMRSRIRPISEAWVRGRERKERLRKYNSGVFRR